MLAKKIFICFYIHVINSVTNTPKYKDPLNSNGIVLMSYSNELGTAISEIAPKLGTALWAPTLMYLGADIYDKYKNDRDNYDPSAKRALNRAIYQGATSLCALPAVIYAGQCLVSPLGRLDKTGISGNTKDSIYKHIKDVIDQAHSNCLETYDSFENVVVKSLENKIHAANNEKSTGNFFKRVYKRFFTNKFDLLKSDKNKIIDFAKKNTQKTFEIMQALKSGEVNKVPKKVYKTYSHILPTMKDMYHEADYSYHATRTALKKFQSTLIFKNKILKTVGGFAALFIFMQPVNNFVEKQLMKKFIAPGIDNIITETVNNSVLNKLLHDDTH